jgi:hypothetical protein
MPKRTTVALPKVLSKLCDNPYYDASNHLLISYDSSNNQSGIKHSEPTKYAVQLARALYSRGIKIRLEPEIWYTSCNFYTPDILVKKDRPLNQKIYLNFQRLIYGPQPMLVVLL